MRLRELTSTERADIDRRRAAVREALAGIEAPWNPGAAAVDEAPFMEDWSTHPYPGNGRICLRGFCYGHPVLGDTIVTTSPVEHQGPGWAITKTRLYVLGAENRDHMRARILAGCQTALNIDPGSASNFDPLDRYGGTPLISPAKRVGVA